MHKISCLQTTNSFINTWPPYVYRQVCPRLVLCATWHTQGFLNHPWPLSTHLERPVAVSLDTAPPHFGHVYIRRLRPHFLTATAARQCAFAMASERSVIARWVRSVISGLLCLVFVVRAPCLAGGCLVAEGAMESWPRSIVALTSPAAFVRKIRFKSDRSLWISKFWKVIHSAVHKCANGIWVRGMRHSTVDPIRVWPSTCS